MTFAALALSLQLLAAPPPPPFAVRTGAGWLLVDRDARTVGRVDRLADLVPDSLIAISSNRYVFTAQRPEDEHALLWLFEDAEGGPSLRLLGHPSGLHAHPTVDATETTVYFSYHPDPALMMRERKFTQIWAVGVDDGGLRQLTDSPGCKLSPAIFGERLVYAHAACGTGRQGLSETKLGTGAEGALREASATLTLSPALSPDGRLIAWLAAGASELRLECASSEDLEHPVTLWRARRGPNWLRPLWASTRELLLGLSTEVAVISAAACGRSTGRRR